jgi:hypothetical protein
LLEETGETVSKRKIRSQVAQAGYSTHSFEYTAGGANPVISGVTVHTGEKLPKTPKVNTNANRKNGGGGMYFKPRTSSFYGY